MNCFFEKGSVIYTTKRNEFFRGIICTSDTMSSSKNLQNYLFNTVTGNFNEFQLIQRSTNKCLINQFNWTKSLKKNHGWK